MKHVRIVYNIPAKNRDAKQFDCIDNLIVLQNTNNDVTMPTNTNTIFVIAGHTAFMYRNNVSGPLAVIILYDDWEQILS